MDKKHLIKKLEKIPGNPDIGINVLTDNGSEFWSLGPGSFKLFDKDTNLSIFQVRQRKAMKARDTIRVAAPPIDSLDCTLENVLAKFCEKFEVKGDLSVIGSGDMGAMEFILETIRQEVCDLVRINEDFLRIFNDPKFDKYHLLDNKE